MANIFQSIFFCMLNVLIHYANFSQLIDRVSVLLAGLPHWQFYNQELLKHVLYVLLTVSFNVGQIQRCFRADNFRSIHLTFYDPNKCSIALKIKLCCLVVFQRCSGGVLSCGVLVVFWWRAGGVLLVIVFILISNEQH